MFFLLSLFSYLSSVVFLLWRCEIQFQSRSLLMKINKMCKLHQGWNYIEMHKYVCTKEFYSICDLGKHDDFLILWEKFLTFFFDFPMIFNLSEVDLRKMNQKQTPETSSQETSYTGKFSFLSCYIFLLILFLLIFIACLKAPWISEDTWMIRQF